MYQEKKTIPKKKKIELLVGLLILLWLLFLITDYSLYSNGKKPIFVIKTTATYPDGKVYEYHGLFYNYRVYDRTSIQDEEFVPFWKPKINPNPIVDIPEAYVAGRDYDVPDNSYQYDKFMGLLYFYNKQSSLLGTYKCINNVDCSHAKTGYDEYDISMHNPLDRFSTRYKINDAWEKYGFIDDSKEQTSEYGSSTYERIIYLYDIENSKILARFGDIKGSIYDDIYENLTGDKEKYIVKDYKTNKWGIIEIKEDGSIKEVLPYEYESINYNPQTGYYIMKKDNEWFLYDLKNNNQISDGYLDVIYDAWINTNKTIYIATGKEHYIGDYKYIDYKIYRLDGKEFLSDNDIVGIFPRDTYLMYIKRDTNEMIFINYAKDVKDKYKLYFTETERYSNHLPCVEIISERETSLTFKIYSSSIPKSSGEEITISPKYWT